MPKGGRAAGKPRGSNHYAAIWVTLLRKMFSSCLDSGMNGYAFPQLDTGAHMKRVIAVVRAGFFCSFQRESERRASTEAAPEARCSRMLVIYDGTEYDGVSSSFGQRIFHVFFTSFSDVAVHATRSCSYGSSATRKKKVKKRNSPAFYAFAAIWSVIPFVKI